MNTAVKLIASFYGEGGFSNMDTTSPHTPVIRSAMKRVANYGVSRLIKEDGGRRRIIVISLYAFYLSKWSTCNVQRLSSRLLPLPL